MNEIQHVAMTYFHKRTHIESMANRWLLLILYIMCSFPLSLYFYFFILDFPLSALQQQQKNYMVSHGSTRIAIIGKS